MSSLHRSEFPETLSQIPVLGEDWQAWCVYITAALVLVGFLVYGFWKGNG